MDVGRGLGVKLKKFLTKLKAMNVIRSFAFEMGKSAADDSTEALVAVDAILEKCLGELDSSAANGRLKTREGSAVEEGSSTVGDDGAYLCDKCGKRFDSLTKLKAHVVREAEAEFSCHVCGRLFRRARTLRKHERLKHPEQSEREVFTCGSCGKSFEERGKLNRHVLSHERGRHECSSCGRAFARADNLRRHVALRHDSRARSFPCRHCAQTFSLRFNRNVHERNVHAEERTRVARPTLRRGGRLPCTLCPRTFLGRSQYQTHLKKRHKGRSPFQNLFDSFAENDGG